MILYSGLASAIEANVIGYSKRVFPLVAPESFELPYSTYQQIFSSSIKTLDGYDGEKNTDYQINFYATTYVAAKAAGNLFVEYIKNFKGTLGTTDVQDVEILNEYDSSEIVSSKNRYVTIIDVRFFCSPI